MDMRIDWIVKTIREMKDEITGKKEIKSLIMEIIRCECEDIKKELKQVIIEQMGRVKEEIQNWKSEGVNILNETVKTELQKGLCHTSVTNSETGEIKKSYSGAAKNQRESVLIVKPKNGEKNNLSENTKKIDIAKLGVGITKMKKVAGGAVVIGCENKDQAEKLKDEVARDLGDEYEVQAPRRRKMKLKIFDVDKEDCEDEQGFWEKIRDQNELRMNSIERKIIHKVVRANSKRMTVVAVVNAETRERFLQLEKLKIVWHEPKITDHSAIVLYWDRKLVANENKLISYRDYKRMDINKFKGMIRSGLDAIEGDNINMKWQGKQWYCEDVYQAIRQRDEAHRVARVSGNGEDWKIFQQLRNKVVDVCRKTKRRYMEEKLDKNKKDLKQMWRVLKELVKGKVTDKEYMEVQLGNRIIKGMEEMADKFNHYCIDSIKVFTNMDDGECSIKDRNYNDSVFETFAQIETEHLVKIVRNLENKAGTEEGITVEIMKHVVEVAAGKICHVFNKSFEEGMFPKEWKEGTNRIEEFRPVNKLPVYENILEKVVHEQVVEFLENNEMISECQSGFRKKHSCETALQWVVSEWKRAIGDGMMIGVVFLDLRRAFEIVDREILIKKLQWFGIKGAVLKHDDSRIGRTGLLRQDFRIARSPSEERDSTQQDFRIASMIWSPVRPWCKKKGEPLRILAEVTNQSLSF
ncbi:hypothetical protein DMN91_008787 [Ooceraea biroi]|uniref:Uncharacterized protein n=1 Tax=Ooceraea biroi TaxID=2015173 RepID=A0A3L8DD79_OOCBI|nr:hypothetical protein DMN91_008787 [Ooceraea biroi]